MITLITDKLQNQSLEDVHVTTYEDIIPYRTRNKVRYWKLDAVKQAENNGENLFVVKAQTTECDWKTNGNNKPLFNKGDSQQHGNCGTVETPASQTPLVPPKKRHCRSRSTGELSGNAKSKWQPKASSIWKPVRTVFHRDYTAGSPHHFSSANSIVNGPNLPIGINNFSTPPESPIPRPASANLDGTAPWLDGSPMKHAHVQKVRSLSLSEDGISEGFRPSVIQVPDAAHKQFGLPRCRSQPCVFDRKAGLKRRRDEDSARPALDFEKMKQTSYDRCSDDIPPKTQYLTVRNSRSLATLFKEPDKFLGLMPIASSPCDSNVSSSVMITPSSSPTRKNKEVGCSAGNGAIKDESEPIHYDHDDSEDKEEEEIFQIDAEDLDLESIEKY
ncbi:protein FAM53A-like [Ptychodera flava]|uniref:protein FAM53A-like n=1 Tax=Ptychodera flava TaxID=63121 RepID=UPI00396A0BE2